MNVAKRDVFLPERIPRVTFRAKELYASLSEAKGFGGTGQFRSSQADGQRTAAGSMLDFILYTDKFIYLFGICSDATE